MTDDLCGTILDELNLLGLLLAREVDDVNEQLVQKMIQNAVVESESERELRARMTRLRQDQRLINHLAHGFEVYRRKADTLTPHTWVHVQNYLRNSFREASDPKATDPVREVLASFGL